MLRLTQIVTPHRPSVDPELMFHMLLEGCCLGIRSGRRLCEKVHSKLAYRWFIADRPQFDFKADFFNEICI